MVGVSASVNLPLHHKVQRCCSSGTTHPGCSGKRVVKRLWCGGGFAVLVLYNVICGSSETPKDTVQTGAAFLQAGCKKANKKH